MEEILTFKLSEKEIKNIIYEYYNIDASAKFEITCRSFEEADIYFQIKQEKNVQQINIEQKIVVTIVDFNNILNEKLINEGLEINNYSCNKGGNYNFSFLMYKLRKKEKVKQKKYRR